MRTIEKSEKIEEFYTFDPWQLFLAVYFRFAFCFLILKHLCNYCDIVGLVAPLGLGFFKKLKVTLEIEKPILLKKSFDQIEGYQLKVGVKNKGKGTCLNPSAKFEVKDSLGASPELLNVQVNITDGKRESTASTEAMRAIDYAWIDSKERIFKVLNELKSNYSFSLLYPYETFFAGVGSSTSSSEYLLKLKANTDYEVEIEIDGKDHQNNIVTRKKKFRLKA